MCNRSNRIRLHKPHCRHAVLARAATWACATLVTAMHASAQTQNSYPMLMSIRPVAVQIGQTTECEVSARYNLYGASRVFVSSPSVTAEIVPPEKKEGEKPPETKPSVPKIKVRFQVAADAVPGVHDVRIVTPQGVSTVAQLVLVRDPVTFETADNNTPAKAQEITLPATACGAIETAEDIDYFKFKVDAGTALTFHVRAQRLEDRIHDLQEHADPIITIRNATGTTLATCDNYYAGDPLLHYTFAQAGEYFLEIRDVRYKGNADWVYAIDINSRPFVTQIHPLAVVAGGESTHSLVGFNLPAGATAAVSVPAGTPSGLRHVAPLIAGQPANAISVLVSELPVAIEPDSTRASETTATPVASPAAAPDSPASPPSAAPIRVPACIGGRIESPGQIDRYTIEAKAGEKLSFEVIARRAGSALDANLRLLNAQGGVLLEVDDSQYDRVNHADSRIENWVVPADGTYTVELRDLHLGGGPQFVYALEVTRSRPYFTLEADTDKTLLAPGSAAPVYVRVVRKNGFAGDVQLAVEDLPAGVTAAAGRILATGQDGCIILRAAPDAPAGAANIRIVGTATHPMDQAEPLALKAIARPLQELYFPGGGRGHYPVESHAVSVADPMDIRAVRIDTTAIQLKPGESRKIEVSIERAPGFKGNVTLDVLYQHLEQPYGNSLPKGVSVDVGGSKTLLTAEESKGFITLKAAADAPAVTDQLVPVMAHVSVNFVMKMTYCAEPLMVTVASPDGK